MAVAQALTLFALVAVALVAVALPATVVAVMPLLSGGKVAAAAKREVPPKA